MSSDPIERLERPVFTGDVFGGPNGPFGVATIASGDAAVSVANTRVTSGDVIIATVHATARDSSSLGYAIEVDSLVAGTGFVFVTSSGLATIRTTNVHYAIFSRL